MAQGCYKACDRSTLLSLVLVIISKKFEYFAKHCTSNNVEYLILRSRKTVAKNYVVTNDNFAKTRFILI